jgi:hypothetical protein
MAPAVHVLVGALRPKVISVAGDVMLAQKIALETDERGALAQDSRLLNHARKVRNRLFAAGRRLSLFGLPNLRQVLTGQDRQEAGCHPPSKRTSLRQANCPIGWAWNISELLQIAVLNLVRSFRTVQPIADRGDAVVPVASSWDRLTVRF